VVFRGLCLSRSWRRIGLSWNVLLRLRLLPLPSWTTTATATWTTMRTSLALCWVQGVKQCHPPVPGVLGDEDQSSDDGGDQPAGVVVPLPMQQRRRSWRDWSPGDVS